MVIGIPDDVSSPLAAAASCALRTVLHAFERLGPVAPHEIAVVQGSGAVGLYATAMARRSGFKRVFVVGAPRRRLELATYFGADDVFDIEEQSDPAAQVEWVLDETRGRGADVVIQCASAGAIDAGLTFVRTGGRLLSIGGGRRRIEVDGQALSSKTVTVISVRSGESRHLYQALQMLSSSDTEFERMLSRPYGLDDVGLALQNMEELADVKSLILPGGPSDHRREGG